MAEFRPWRVPGKTMCRKARMATCALALTGTGVAHADLTGFGAVGTTENPATLGVAGITLLQGSSAAALTENPGAIPFQQRSLELSTTTPLHETFKARERQTTVSRGAAAAASFSSPLGRAGAAVGLVNRDLQNRFQATSESSLGYESSDIELRPALGLRVFDELGLGLTAVYSFGSDRIRQWSPGLKIEEQTYQGLALRLGSLLRLGSFSAALAWQSDALMQAEKTITPIDSPQLGTPYKPAKVSAAAGYDFPPLLASSRSTFLATRVMAELDVTYFPRAQSSVLRPGSRVYKETYWLYVPWSPDETRVPQKLDTRPRTVPRAALETELMRNEDVALAMALGAYLEPPLLVSGDERFHNTAGAKISFQGFSADFGCDFAEGYRNFHMGAGAAIPLR